MEFRIERTLLPGKANTYQVFLSLRCEPERTAELLGLIEPYRRFREINVVARMFEAYRNSGREMYFVDFDATWHADDIGYGIEQLRQDLIAAGFEDRSKEPAHAGQ